MQIAKIGLHSVRVIIWIINGLGVLFLYMLAIVASGRRLPDDLQDFSAILLMTMILTFPVLGLIKFLLNKIYNKEDRVGET